MDVMGKALLDYYRTGYSDTVWLHNNYGNPEEMPVDIFFRSTKEMPELELMALHQCKGQILDIGAGVGSHAIALQKMGRDVVALEISELSCEIMKLRGVHKICCADVLSWKSVVQFDTLLLLMNGIGLAGDLNGLKVLLKTLKNLLKPGGQILFDSSDITYLYEDTELPNGRYFGEVSYQYEYQSVKGNWFNWLYLDFDTLQRLSNDIGFTCDLLYKDEMDQYLARLIPNTKQHQ